MSEPANTGVARAATVAQLLRALVDSDPGRPRLTWYDDAAGPTHGERIELSARVLVNWVAKAANLLTGELDIEPGDRIALALPPHWRAAYWLLAAWSVGAQVVVGDLHDARVVITDDPASVPSGPAVVAVTLPALARAWAGAPLPAHALDEASTVTGQPDVFEPFDEPDPSAPAYTVSRLSVPYADLLATARELARNRGWQPGARVLTSSGPEDALAGLLAPLVVDGSLVLVRDPDPELVEERRRTEQVTSP